MAAGVAELVDAPDLGSGGVTRAGSSPVARIDENAGCSSERPVLLLGNGGVGLRAAAVGEELEERGDIEEVVFPVVVDIGDRVLGAQE